MSISCKSHCCILHGCKYGHGNICPVVNEVVIQDYPCEDCHYYGLETISDVLNKHKRIPDSDIDELVTVLDNIGARNFIEFSNSIKIVSLWSENSDMYMKFLFNDHGKFLSTRLERN